MNGECHHLRDCWEVCNGAEVPGVLPVPAPEDQDCSPFDEPVVLLVKTVRLFPFYHALQLLEDNFLDGRTFL